MEALLLCARSVVIVRLQTQKRQAANVHAMFRILTPVIATVGSPSHSVFMTSPDVLCALVDPFFEVIQHVIAGAHGERDNRHRGRFVGTTWKNACITDV